VLLKLVPTSQFKKDYRSAKKRELEMRELRAVLDKFCAKEPLDERHRDHALSGSYIGFCECYVSSDWLLLYAVGKDHLILTASRTGIHPDPFDEPVPDARKADLRAIECLNMGSKWWDIDSVSFVYRFRSCDEVRCVP
jgi:mRNA interferase YafQ